MPRAILPIVEGQGEVTAVPVLLRRFAHEIFGDYGCTILDPFRLSRTKLRNPAELGKALNFAAARLTRYHPQGAVLLLMDADRDPPCVLGPHLVALARGLRADLPVGVVLAACEFEAWFLAAARSLAMAGLARSDATPPDDPDGIRGAKERLATLAATGQYAATVDQTRFTAAMSLAEARSGSPSFDKLWRELERIFGTLITPAATPRSVRRRPGAA